MNRKLQHYLDNMKRYNVGPMCTECFGFSLDTVYDALVLAPGWKPTKIIQADGYRVTQLTQHSYFSGFLVEKDGLRIAWAQTASGACNLLDHGIICGELQVKHLIFAGAVGGLTDRFAVSELCTPEYCISGVYTNNYLAKKLEGYQPFGRVYPNADYTAKIIALARENGYTLRTAKVFCTDSIALEYSHLDEIKATGAELIEMETSTFYTLAALFDVPAIALLAVSDSSVTGVPLLGRREDQRQAYDYTRGHIIPDMICKIARQ